MLAKQLMCYPVVSGHLYPQLCCMCLLLLVLVLFVCMFVFSLLVCFQVLLVAIRLDSPQRPWIVACFFFTGVAAGCLVFVSIFVLFPLLSLFPGPVWHNYMLYIANKNK